MNMTPDQVREIVRITLDELTARKLIKDDYQTILRNVEGKLKAFFNNKNDSIGYALRTLMDDEYIDVILLQYRDGKTLEWIADFMEVDVSTIKRNKKRLIYRINELLEESV